ncbi:glycerol-3-phosphate dehydrogenase/oxidase [Micropruina sonneratiae]|uniref:glycerol-3-phosphate dehydrogenase/oxidase n=1 Tax=Micropruina sonneratiae TaxID=2986940 RepID=UPI002227B73D|nr:glycerol-3-phosphate dehydrogenase/oxidase [Micropruina sp. KQZ13P-5]MCW3156547.1 glycerol-3-phosphate dehydrogenase/oxidase [Micropruina sp. KQZ13P-5]
MSVTAMNPASRADALRWLAADELDVLVVGGGVTGAGIALDAVTRGLRTGIVEAQDWASGTSSRSSKLVHGGLRYLQALDFKLVNEALHERELLLDTIAPHLVKPVSFLYPLTKRFVERPYVAAGITLYDLLARLGAKATSPFHRHHTLAGVRRLFPDVRPDVMVGAIQYWDGRVDDSRLTLTLVRTAVQNGALAASRTKVTDFVKTGGRVSGALVTDLESGEQFTVRARHVIAAAGVWTETTQDLAEAEGGLKVLASKGIHIVVPKDRLDGEVGFILQTEKSVLFIIPWQRYWVIGTTDTPYHQDFTHPVASASDIDYVLEHANVVLSRPLTRDDVIGTWAGLRPLLQPATKGDGTASTKVSREHTVTEAAPGLVTIAGGKLTTYRVMAQDAVDFALGEAARTSPSRTASTPLLGGSGYRALVPRAAALGAEFGWDEARVLHLLDRYGSELHTLMALCREQADLARPLEYAPDYLRVEIAYGCSHEGALHLEDLLVNRTRLTYEIADSGLAALPEIAALAAERLGWDDARRQAELDAYGDRVEAERAAAEQPDDASAAQARAAAPEVTDAVHA